MILVGLAYRIISGAFDPEGRSWAVVMAAPLAGLFIYLHLSRRESLLAALLIGVGLGALVFWSLILAWGGLPITGGADYLVIAFILSFPVACVWLGWRQWRAAKTGKDNAQP
jgi:hypothetical protein